MKTLAVIKAFGAGVTALYFAVEAAKQVQRGENDMAYAAAKQWLYADDELKQVLGVPN